MGILIACSGPGAVETIRENMVIGDICAAISAVIVAALVFDHWRSGRVSMRLAAAVLLMAFHPAWTVSAIHGDCGFQKRDLSFIVVGLLSALLLWQFAGGRLKSASHSSRWSFSLRTLFKVVTVSAVTAGCAAYVLRDGFWHYYFGLP